MKKQAIIVITFSTLVLFGCSKSLDVNVNFTQSQVVESGDPVKLNGVEIGEVSDVDVLDHGLDVQLELDPEKIELLSTTSAAMIVNQPQRHVQIYANASGEPLKSGSNLQGLNNPVDLATWTAGNALGSLQGLATSAASAFNQFLNESNWDDVAKQLNDSLSDLNQQSAGVLNELGGELEKFIKQMQDQSSESLKQADELSRQLNEALEEFQGQGQEEIARALQNMLDAFNSALDPNAVPEGTDKGLPL